MYSAVFRMWKTLQPFNQIKLSTQKYIFKVTLKNFDRILNMYIVERGGGDVEENITSCGNGRSGSRGLPKYGLQSVKALKLTFG